MGLGLTLAHQHLGQLPGPVKSGAGQRPQPGHLPDGRRRCWAAGPRGRAVPQPRPTSSVSGPFEVAVSLSAGNRTTPPATGRTLPPPPATGMGEAARAQSRSSYGRPRAEVEAAIRAPARGLLPAGPVGRREVSP